MNAPPRTEELTRAPAVDESAAVSELFSSSGFDSHVNLYECDANSAPLTDAPSCSPPLCLLGKRFGECGWRATMCDDKYKSLFQSRSRPIVKNMHRLLKDSDIKRAKARTRLAARVDIKAKARVRSVHGR